MTWDELSKWFDGRPGETVFARPPEDLKVGDIVQLTGRPAAPYGPFNADCANKLARIIEADPKENRYEAEMLHIAGWTQRFRREDVTKVSNPDEGEDEGNEEDEDESEDE